MGDTPFRLMDVPAELRLLVYDHLLAPVTIKPLHLDTFMLPDEFPNTAALLQPYLNLIQTCKTIREEAKPHFEKRYLARMTFYFEHATPVHRFCESTSILGRPYSDANILFHTNSIETSDTESPVLPLRVDAFRFMLHNVDDFHGAHPEYIFMDYRQCLHRFPSTEAEGNRRALVAGAVAFGGIERNGRGLDVVRIPGVAGSGTRVYMRSTCDGRLGDHQAYFDIRVKASEVVVCANEVEECAASLARCEKVGRGGGVGILTRGAVKRERVRLCREVLGLEAEVEADAEAVQPALTVPVPGEIMPKSKEATKMKVSGSGSRAVGWATRVWRWMVRAIGR
ncbi:hypothetical protein Tdes44962_MAKER09878 [Teratosphaeria destructans]|uniref:F-box domain-containing protein n=1 Tax=Teratosphaeria destructans TaxID=418781 RepID=A0A9W7SQY5_9PEZI|nr:hypothetical protein Tdes44962_MAKER09878 [Teratosphaeria destructans]